MWQVFVYITILCLIKIRMYFILPGTNKRVEGGLVSFLVSQRFTGNRGLEQELRIIPQVQYHYLFMSTSSSQKHSTYGLGNNFIFNFSQTADLFITDSTLFCSLVNYSVKNCLLCTCHM